MLLFSCSGPGAASIMLYHTDYGYKHAIIVGILLIASLVLGLFATRYRWLPITVGALLALHPAWAMSAYRGDCGYSKASWSFAFSIGASCIVGLQVILLVSSVVRKPVA